MAVCSTVMPAVNADLCAPGVNYGQIEMLMFTRNGDGLTDFLDDTEWAARIDNDSTGTEALPTSGNAEIRQLFGIGSLEAPERPEVTISRRRKVYADPKFTMTFAVDDTGDVNWNTFMRGLPSGGQVYSVWFATKTRIFGGNDGITATIVANPSIPESTEETQKIILTVTWEGTIPEAGDNPLV